MKDEKRDSFYDCVKGFAILLVVLGHMIQSLDTCDNPLYLGVYLFHMPLFAFLSGLFFVRSYERYTPFALIKRRFVQLMVPCLSWGSLSLVVVIAGKILKHKPMDFVFFFQVLYSSLWYLSTIFGLILIGIVVHSLVRRYLGGGGYIIGWSLAFAVLYFMPYFKGGNIQHLEFLCPFFALGVLTRHFSYARLKGWVALCAAAVYLVAYHFFSFDVSLYKMSSALSAAEHLYGTLIRLAGGVSGSLLAMYLIQVLMRFGKAHLAWLATLGTLTLPIYAMHQWFFKLNKVFSIASSNLFVLLLGTAVVTSLTLVAYKLLAKNRYLGFFLFGIKPKSRV